MARRNKELDRELDRVLEEARLKLTELRLEIPELEVVPPPDSPPARSPPAVKAEAPPRWRRADLLLGSLGLLLAAWVGLLWSGASGARPRRSFPLPMGAAIGPVVRDGTLLVLDPARQLLLTLGRQGQVQGVARFDGPAIAGLAATEDGFWSTASGGRIASHERGEGFPARKVYRNPHRTPRAVAWDGATLWVSDPVAQSVYQFAPKDSLLPLREVPLAGLKPAGLHRSEDLLWVLDGPTRTVYRYRVGPMPTLVDQLPLGAWLDPQARVSGMAVAGDALWLLTEPPVTLHRFDVKELRWTRLLGSDLL
ncbi:MAG: hypothetical protein HY554_16525 [Elusimicrobia bacterium]|nr:hypothetical protein [Elusimicrobiota bacterium]